MIGSPRSIVLYSKCSHLLRCLVRCKLHKFCFLSSDSRKRHFIVLCMVVHVTNKIWFNFILIWFKFDSFFFLFLQCGSFRYHLCHKSFSKHSSARQKEETWVFFFSDWVQTEKEKIGFKRTMQKKKKKNLLLFTSCFKN